MSKDIEVNGRAVAVRETASGPRELAVQTELSAQDIKARLDKITEVQRDAMTPGVDFGTIPGTSGPDGKSRPTLLKPGAEKLCVLFRLDCQFIGEGNREVESGIHLTVYRYCTIYSQVSGERLGGASAMCSSKESKYRWRKAGRKCPECGKETILKSKYPDRDTGDLGFYCFAKKGGCGANFQSSDERITKQTEGRVENEDIADQFNTIIRMAEKRAMTAAVRLVTGASAIFDEEMPDAPDGHVESPATTQQPPAGASGPAQAADDAGKEKKTRQRAPKAKTQASGNGAPGGNGDKIGEAELKVLEGLFSQVKFDSAENQDWYRKTICKQFGVEDFAALKKPQFEIACKVLRGKLQGQGSGAQGDLA